MVLKTVLMSETDYKEDNPEELNHRGNIFLQDGHLEKAAECYQRAISVKNDYFQAYNNLGNVFFRQGRFDDAALSFQKVLSLKPDYFGAYYNLGLVYSQQGQLDTARKYYQQTILLNPDFYSAYNNLGNVYLQQDQLETSAKCYQQALFLKPDHYEACNNLGNVFFHLGKLKEAEDCYEKVLSLNPDQDFCYRVYMHQGLLFLLSGRFKEGWEKYEFRYHLPEFKYLQKIHLKWDGSVMPGKTILVRYEQGFGDTIQFIRYLPLVKKRCGKLIFVCQRQLKSLFKAFPGIDQMLTKYPEKEEELEYHSAISMMSLPGIFKTDHDNIPADIPYIFPDKNISSEFQKKISSDKLNIGLVWSGNPKYKQDCKRSVPLSEFAPLAKISGINFHSLQVGNQAKEIRYSPDGMIIYDWHERLHDFADTAGLIANLDLVITVDTSVAHLAGAMGKPVWTLLPFVPDWRWLMNQEDTPWYPTMRLFRQPHHGKWKPVIEKVAEELALFSSSRSSLNLKNPPTATCHLPPAPRKILNLKECRHGQMLYIRNDIYIGRSLDLYSEFSEGEVILFRQLIKKGDVVIEAGANIGAHTIAIAKIIGPAGKIIAYEPQRFIFQILCTMPL